MRNLAYRNTFSNYAFAASPVFEHNGGNVPIQFFGKPFTIVSNETRHCLHGPIKVRIPFENRVWIIMKRTSSIRFLHNPRNCFNFSRYFSEGIHGAFSHTEAKSGRSFTSEFPINIGCVQFLRYFTNYLTFQCWQIFSYYVSKKHWTSLNGLNAARRISLIIYFLRDHITVQNSNVTVAHW